MLNCSRTLARTSGATVYLVQQSQPRKNIGIGVPSKTFAEACELAEETHERRAAIVRAKDDRDLSAAEAVIERRFPLMPRRHRELALKHAFVKRSGRVGRTGKLDEETRVCLAVAAHARHHMTPYDSELRWLARSNIPREEVRNQARKLIGPRLEQVLAEWRGCSLPSTHPSFPTDGWNGIIGT